MFQILNGVGWRESGGCAALSVVIAILLFPNWSLNQGNHKGIPAVWGCISPRVPAWRPLSYWLVEKCGHPQKVISPICDMSLEMLLLLRLQKEPRGNITAAIQILGWWLFFLGFFGVFFFQLGGFWVRVGLGFFFVKLRPLTWLKSYI